jgi:hypothetical protein
LLDRRQRRGFAPADQRPFGDQRAANAAENRRRHLGVVKVELGSCQRGLQLFESCFGDIVFLTAHRPDFQQRLVALDDQARGIDVRLRRFDCGRIIARVDLK